MKCCSINKYICANKCIKNNCLVVRRSKAAFALSSQDERTLDQTDKQVDCWLFGSFFFFPLFTFWLVLAALKQLTRGLSIYWLYMTNHHYTDQPLGRLRGLRAKRLHSKDLSLTTNRPLRANGTKLITHRDSFCPLFQKKFCLPCTIRSLLIL